MNFNDIINKTIRHKAQPEGMYQNFAVLVPLIETPNGIKIIFEVRSKNLSKQPGEVCFPGGKVDKDESFKQAAIRETCEELNLKEQNIEIIGDLDYLVTPYNLIIYPYVGIIKGVNYGEITCNPDEVHEIFDMDLNYPIDNKEDMHIVNLLANPQADFPYHMVIQGEEYKWRVGKYPVPFYQYKDKVIWGFTARILSNFGDILRG